MFVRHILRFQLSWVCIISGMNKRLSCIVFISSQEGERTHSDLSAASFTSSAEHTRCQSRERDSNRWGAWRTWNHEPGHANEDPVQ